MWLTSAATHYFFLLQHNNNSRHTDGEKTFSALSQTQLQHVTSAQVLVQDFTLYNQELHAFSSQNMSWQQTRCHTVTKNSQNMFLHGVPLCRDSYCAFATTFSNAFQNSEYKWCISGAINVRSHSQERRLDRFISSHHRNTVSPQNARDLWIIAGPLQQKPTTVWR